MSNRENLHAQIIFSVSDCERKPVQNKSASEVLADRPTPRRFDHQGYGAIYFGNKFLGGRLTALQVPLHGRFQFLKGSRMNLDPLTGHCSPAMENGCDLLARLRPGHRLYPA